MSKRIWFVQQQQFDFMPLKAGLGIITEEQLQEYTFDRYNRVNPFPYTLCPKIYTTRTRPMAGEYQVVRGSRFKAVPLDPPIQFKVIFSAPFNLKTLTVSMENHLGWSPQYLDRFTVPELDLGLVGTTAEMLRDELLKLNKKATLDTPMYINKLEPINNG